MTVVGVFLLLVGQLYLDGEITEESAKRTIETLLKLDIINHKDIKMYRWVSNG